MHLFDYSLASRLITDCSIQNMTWINLKKEKHYSARSRDLSPRSFAITNSSGQSVITLCASRLHVALLHVQVLYHQGSTIRRCQQNGLSAPPSVRGFPPPWHRRYPVMPEPWHRRYSTRCGDRVLWRTYQPVMLSDCAPVTRDVQVGCAVFLFLVARAVESSIEWSPPRFPFSSFPRLGWNSLSLSHLVMAM
jgi:hypothetical protein